MRRAHLSLAALLVAAFVAVFPGDSAGQAFRAAAAPAQAAPAAEAAQPEGPPPIQPVAPERVAEEADRTAQTLERLRPSQRARDAVETITEELAKGTPVIEARIERGRDALETASSISALQDAHAQLRAILDPIGDREKILDGYAAEAAEALAEVERLAARWSASRDLARTGQAGEPVRKRIELTRKAVGAAEKELRAHRDAILALREKLLDARTRVEQTARSLDEAVQGGLAHLLESDQAPIWSPDFWTSLSEEWREKGLDPVRESLAHTREYLRTNVRRLGVQLAVFAALAALLLRRRRHARNDADLDAARRAAEPLFERPYSSALLISFLLTPLLYLFPPLLFEEMVVVLGVIPAIRIIHAISGSAMNVILYPAVVLFVVDRLRLVLAPLHSTWRLLFLLEVAAALTVLVRIVRATPSARLAGELRENVVARRLALASRVALAAMAVALVAGITGWAGLASVLGSGTLSAGYAALILYAGAKVLQALVAYFVTSRAAHPMRVLTRYGEGFRRIADRLIELGAVAIWVVIVLRDFRLADRALEIAQAVLTADLSIGALSISAGDVIVFGVTLWISFLLARLLAFILEEDVFPRVELARGVPYALTSLARYSVLFVGFLFALAAAGFDVDRIAFLAGGLGVGIGFGLQNVVNNFVSGLILLFERPVQVDDSVTLPAQNLMGKIRRIGIRASVIRTWDGAEVIVPNGDLISSVVTNWTLSDRIRRLDIPVRVAHGTPPQRVIDLLIGLAQAHENVIDTPGPVVFFTNIGESALEFELRSWVRDFDVGLSTRSALVTAVEETLRREGIAVPHPQMDVHVGAAPGGPAAPTEPAAG